MLRSFSAASEVIGTDPGECAAQAARVTASAVRRCKRSPERSMHRESQDAAQRAGRLYAVRVVEAPVEGDPRAEGDPAGEEVLELEAEPSINLVRVEGASVEHLSEAEVRRDLRSVASADVEPHRSEPARERDVPRRKLRRFLQAHAERHEGEPHLQVAAVKERHVLGQVSVERFDAAQEPEVESEPGADGFIAFSGARGKRAGTDQDQGDPSQAGPLAAAQYRSATSPQRAGAHAPRPRATGARSARPRAERSLPSRLTHAHAPSPSSQRTPSGAVPVTRSHPICTQWRW